MKKRNIVLSSCIIVIMLVGFVHAGIFFSDLEDKYNLGDMVEINVQVDPIVDGRLLKTKLFCNGDEIIEFNNLPDDGGLVVIKLPLNYFTLDTANGVCYFMGDYYGEQKNSNDFEISKLLLVYLDDDSFFVSPGDEITVLGLAEKINGNPVEGEVEIKVPLLSLLDVTEEVVEDVFEHDDSEEEVGNETKVDESDAGNEEVVEEIIENVVDEVVSDYKSGIYNGPVVDGRFSVNIKFPNDTPAGDFRIEVLVFEGSSDKKSSEGVALANLKVFQIPIRIEVALNNQDIDPGENIEIKPSILDQSGGNIDDEISVIIRNEVGERFFEKIIKSQETIVYNIPTNATSGTYEIDLTSGDLTDIKSFFVNQKAIAKFGLINDTLVITNVGNIPYNKGVEVDLNGKTFVKLVDLQMGESITFKLTGPDDDYNVKISDGNSEVTQSGVKLTGRVVNVDTVRQGVLGVSGPIAWIFFIMILMLILVFLFRNVFKKKSFAFHFKGKGKSKLFGKKKGEIKSDVGKNENVHVGGKGHDLSKNQNDIKSTIQKQADQVLVLKGHKSVASALVLKIKNKIGKAEKESLEKAIQNVYDKKGALYEQGDFIFIIFSPLMTKTNKNEVEAAKVAQKIVNVLHHHNKKFRDRIDFGIGINTGEIINKIEEGKLKFTALGNFIVAAKRLAENSNKQVLVTKEAFEKGIAEIKAEKIKLNEGEVYDVRRVVDVNKNKKFISNFLNRQGKGK